MTRRLLVVLGLLPASAPARLPAQSRSDTAEARRVFEGNIDAIHKRDRARYLSYYLDSETFARNGFGGLQLGYAPMAAERDTTWPDSLIATDLHWIAAAPACLPLRCAARVRYRQRQQACTVTAIDAERCAVRFDEAQRAVTPGQYVVLYAGEECLGGGVIASSEGARPSPIIAERAVPA